MKTLLKSSLSRRAAIILGAASALALSTSFALAADPMKVWHHGGKADGERGVIAKQIDAWNAANPATPAELVLLPEAAYNEQVQAAALAGTLPDLLDFDGPNYANYVWSGYLDPMNGLVDQAVIDDLLPSLVAQGTYAPDGKLYAIGQFDSGLGLWGSKEKLTKAGIRIPTGVADAWTGAEFEDALKKLKASGVEFPLDMKLNYGKGEWYTYGFSPMLQSMGGDLINRTTWKAEGTLNSAGSIKAMAAFQGWIKAGYVVPASAGDDNFYGKKNVGLALVGHWMYGAHSKALGEDLILLPMPKFGDKHVTGMGSWCWGISTSSTKKPDTAKLLAFLMSDANIVEMTTSSGAVPGTKTAADKQPLFAAGGKLRNYVDQLTSIAVPRPAYPGYPVITASFAQAVDDIINGADVKASLDKAAAAVDADSAANKGYPPFTK